MGGITRHIEAPLRPEPTATKRIHNHFQLDATKIKRAQKALHAKTETEAIERALDFAIGEHEKIAWFFRPRSAFSRVESRSVTFTALWQARSNPPFSTPPSISPLCVEGIERDYRRLNEFRAFQWQVTGI